LTAATGTVDFWQRYRAGWHVLAGAAFLLVGAFIAANQALPVEHRAVTIGLFVVLAGWYATVGVRAVRYDCGGDRLGVIYFAGALILLVAIYWVAVPAAFLLFAFTPQVFVMIHRWRTRLIVLFLLYGEVAAATLNNRGASGETLGLIAVTVLVPMIAGLLMGGYITGIIEQSRRRAILIEELTRTQEELAAQRHAAGVHAERERLAAEIHDTLAQGFTSILMLTRSTRVLLDHSAPPDSVAASLELVERTARENLAEARALVAALAPPDLVDRTLADALTRLAERHTRDTGVPVTVAVHGSPTGLAQETNVVLLRAVQEALSNIGRHAAASQVRVELSYGAQTASVAIVDDGRGFDPEQESGGYGLAGLRSRAAALGGTCSVGSAPNTGTSVVVELPRPDQSRPTQSRPTQSRPTQSRPGQPGPDRPAVAP
jgi:signal transduction histidine kinase